MLKIQYGNNIEIEFPFYHSCDAGWYKEAEKKTKQFFIDSIKPNFNIIDAGAQIGMYAALFSKLAYEGNVFAFEPTETIEILKKNLQFNNCNNVILHQVALSDKDETKVDKIYRIWSQNVVDEKEFEFLTVDSFVQKNQLKIDLIKIDVDSYDYEVLLGSKNFFKNQNPIVAVELNCALSKRGYTAEQAIDFMTSIDYRLEQTLDNENFIFRKKQ